MLPKLVIILGPTAVGKSELAMGLAEAIGGAIVNADSQQVYRFLDIGTGKPTLVDRERVAHFMIDVVDPDQEFNAAQYRRMATASIEQIRDLGRHAIVCGGTGLYLKALTQGLFDGPGADTDIRCALTKRIEIEGLASLYRWLTDIDPVAAAAIHPNDRQRTMRALEVYQATGKRLSDWQSEHGFEERQFELLKIGLTRPRDELYARINQRCEKMVEGGFLDELRNLSRKGFALTLKPLRSIGYRQMGQVLEGRQSLVDALAEMKQETRHYAKRQFTWFHRDPEIRWFEPQETTKIIYTVKTFLEI